MQLIPPTNSVTLAFYLLLEAGIKGVTNYDAVVNEKFFKFNTRVSNLILDHNIPIHKKVEKGTNRFGHSYNNTRYALYISDLEENIKKYNEINKKK